MNNALIVGSIVAVFVILFILYQKSKSKTQVVEEVDFSTFEELVDGVKYHMVDVTKEVSALGLTEAQFNAQYRRVARIETALRECVFGIDSAKIIVIELIRSFISNKLKPERVASLLGLTDGMIPTDHIMFEILMYRYKRMPDGEGGFYGRRALDALLTKYDLARDRFTPEGRFDNYYFTAEELLSIYEQENIYLSEAEQCDLLAILVYQQYKGFGILDTLREMDINGFNIGTSGSIMKNVTAQADGLLQATESAWVYYKGKYIHFRFMSFGHEDEIKRVVQLIARFNNPGSLTAKRGYLVNTMFDKSRVLALRPPAGEYWAVFVRKFTISNPSPENLLIKDYTKNGELVIELMDYLVNGLMTIGVTGRQGSGKTTLMSSIIRFIDNRLTIRILEMAPELYLREIYPNRNIMSVQETQYITAMELQDALKKSDAAYSIVGEVATDQVAARMVQMGMTASLATIFSHHATTTPNLVYTLRNSLVNAGGFTMETAERQILQILHFNIHLDYDAQGRRYIERITEVIPLEDKAPLPEIDPKNPEYSYYVMQREALTRQLANITFLTSDVIVYDTKTHTYKVGNRISKGLEAKLRTNLTTRAVDFDKFTLRNWGARKDEGGIDASVVNVLTSYKGKLNLDISSVDVHGNKLSDFDAVFEHLHMNPDLTDESMMTTVLGFLEDENEVKQKEFEIKVKNEREALSGVDAEELEDAVFTLDFFAGGVDI